jgi:hypothetical protein
MGIGLSWAGHATPAGTEFLQVEDFDEKQTFYAYYRQDRENSYVTDFLEFLRAREF